MKQLVMLYCFSHFFVFLGAQERTSCDSLAKVLGEKWDYQSFNKVNDGAMIKKIDKCILKKRIKINEYILSNLIFFKKSTKEEFLKRNLSMLLIKMHPLLDSNLKYQNERGLLSGLKPSDINFGSPKVLKKIKKNFGMSTYFKVLKVLNIKLKDKEKRFLEENLKKPEASGEPEWKTEKWISAIILAKSGNLEAENYLIELTRRITTSEKNRDLIYELGLDLVMTRNRKVINFIIDDFLMSDYSWSSFDTGHEDYEAAFSLLKIVVDEKKVFYDSLIRTDGKSFIRQWFKDHRETYKIKP